jgi:hypothetical protein
MNAKKTQLPKQTQFRTETFNDMIDEKAPLGYAYLYDVRGNDCIIIAATRARLEKVADCLGHTISDKSKILRVGIVRASRSRGKK